MRGRKAPVICLTSRQRGVLEEMVRRPTSSQRDARRAAIILAAATGASNQEIARQLHRDRDTVAWWRNRWHDFADAWQALEENPKVRIHEFRDLAGRILGDAPRPGAPLKFSAEQVCEIIAVACEKPVEESERPVSHWSRRELADEVKKRGIVTEISPRSVGRFLKSGRITAASQRILATPTASGSRTVCTRRAASLRGVPARGRVGGTRRPCREFRREDGHPGD